VLARALHDDPVVCYFYPQAESRPAAFARTTRCLLRYAVRYGEVYASSPRLEGIAMWLPPGRAEPSTWDMLRAGVLPLIWRNGWATFRRLMAYSHHAAAMRQRHVHVPCWYLQIFGVDPPYHGAGYGSRLLRSMLARLDRERVPCCLDTENEVNVPMYEHFGFRVLEASPIPRTDCSVWLLVRDVGALATP
jgi:GNAT superfamily N-acetyltransferase